MERVVPGGGLGERLRPVSLEIDGVRQHQPGLLVEHAPGDQVDDLPLGLLLDPRVDRLPGLLGLVHEVDLGQLGPVRIPRERQEIGKEVIAFLPPEPVRQAEAMRALRPPTGVIEPLPERRELLVEPIGIGREMEDLRHLCRGLSAGPGIRHRQRHRQAGRRIEQVAWLSGQPRMELECEPVVSLHDLGHRRPSRKDSCRQHRDQKPACDEPHHDSSDTRVAWQWQWPVASRLTRWMPHHRQAYGTLIPAAHSPLPLSALATRHCLPLLATRHSPLYR